MSRRKNMWHRHRCRTINGADMFVAAMFRVGFTTYSGSCPVIRDNSKFYGFTWGESMDVEGKKVIIFTPSPEVYASWTWAKELSE